MKPHKTFYYDCKGLPHLQPRHGTFFVTYRLFGSIPKDIFRELKLKYERTLLQLGNSSETGKVAAKAQYLKQLEAQLDGLSNGPYHLREPAIRQLVLNSWLFADKGWADLHALCIMPNHVHVLLSPYPDSLPLYEVMERHKSFTGLMANRMLKKEGNFWAEGYFDRLVRGEKAYRRIFWYILNNPVKAGFVKNWEEWEGSYGV